MTAALYAKIEALEADNRDLRRDMGILRDAEIESRFAQRWGLRPSEAAILALMHRRTGRIVTKALVYDTLYADDPDPPESKVVDVFVSHIRKGMGPGEFVVTENKRGYRLSPAGVAACDDALTVGSC